MKQEKSYTNSLAQHATPRNNMATQWVDRGPGDKVSHCVALASPRSSQTLPYLAVRKRAFNGEEVQSGKGTQSR